MSKYIIGTRWISEAEPELGLGLISNVEAKTVEIIFKNADTVRTYGLKMAPLKRVIFSIGDQVKSVCGTRNFKVIDVQELEGLVVYFGEEEADTLIETDICHNLSFNRPQDKLFNGLISSTDQFDLRMKTLEAKAKYEQSPIKGLMGGRMSLLPHQFYVANKVLSKPLPRVLFADEVGLGKTIEAGLVLHNLIKTDRVKRALILVPDSLVYQWFTEMLKKFNLSFKTINQETHIEEGENPFVDSELCIASLDLIRGSKLAEKMLERASYDLLIVDEAHQLKWTKEGPDHAFSVVEKVANKTPMTFLLTATPEQLGQTGHFARLRLLDPDRFYDLEAFEKEAANYHEVANIAKKILQEEKLESSDQELLKKWQVDENQEKEELLQSLLDRHGTGRILYRNTRANLAKDYDFFPKRILNSYPLEKLPSGSYKEAHNLDDSFYEKAMWLIETLKKLKGQKALLICRSKKKVLELEKFIRENTTGINTGSFHSDLSLMARDRQAAYFTDPEGAQILLCTEIGSEGRNFEFCHHLVLFDLPLSPDLLEQRIGRLDRIGQKCDINLHVPFAKGSFEETLLNWYHQGLNAFEENCKCGQQVFAQTRVDLAASLEESSLCEELVSKTSKLKSEFDEKLEEGRDQLVEYNSYNHDIAYDLVKKLRANDQDHELYDFLDLVYHHLGVEFEELDGFVYFLKPSDNMLIPHFPGLPSDGMRITFDRRVALERGDVQLMTWDHPMVQGVIDLIDSEGVGNISVATRKEGKSNKVFLECYFTLRALKGSGVDVSRFLPTSTIRILVNPQGEDFTEKFSKELLDTKLMESNRELKSKAQKFPKDRVETVLDQAKVLANKKSESLKELARNQASSELRADIERLEYLKSINPSVRESELDFAKERLEKTLTFIEESSIELDSIRLIL